MTDTQDMSNTGPYPAYTPDVSIPVLPAVKPPTVNAMMLAQQERIAENLATVEKDIAALWAETIGELREIKTTLAQFQHQQIVEQIALFALVLVALIGR